MDGIVDTASTPNFAERVMTGRARILTELRKAIVGQDEVVDQVLIALFSGGHCLITGVPGLAKTLLIKTLAEILDLKFKRIQFTPDLMPADITGTEILEEQHGTRALRFVKGPIFAQIILADEINRTPPKTQAALLEAMQEYHVTAAGRTYPLERPFFVLATQNPIELEGTYPLPEAQLDRFMFNVVMTYLTPEEEVRVVTQTTGATRTPPERVLDGAEIMGFQQTVREVLVAEEVARFAVDLVDSSRPGRARQRLVATEDTEKKTQKKKKGWGQRRARGIWIRRSSPGSARSISKRAPSSKGFSADCIAAHSKDSASSSRSIGSTFRATIFPRSTGR